MAFSLTPEQAQKILDQGQEFPDHPGVTCVYRSWLEGSLGMNPVNLWQCHERTEVTATTDKLIDMFSIRALESIITSSAQGLTQAQSQPAISR